MSQLLFIPWFRLHAWDIPLPFSLPALGDTLSIQPFGVLVAIGVLLGAWAAGRFAEQNGLNKELTGDMVTYAVVFGFVGSYFLNGLFYEREALAAVLRDPRELFSHWLGLSSYGGFFAGLLGAWFWSYRKKQPFAPHAEAVVFGTPLGFLFGRIGCFVVHDHAGKVTDFPLAVDAYRFGAPPFQPRHDLGLYEALWLALIMGFFFWLSKKRRPLGTYMALGPLLYAPVRFLLDFLRAAPAEGGDNRFVGLTPAQYMSIAMFVLGLFALTVIRKRSVVQDAVQKAPSS